MIGPSEISVQVANRSTLSGPGNDLPLNELRARGAEQLSGGRRWHVTGLHIECSLQHDYQSTQAGVTAGRRLWEYLSNLTLRVPGWPDGGIVIDAGARALRERTNQMLGMQANVDFDDTVDADATNVATRASLYVPFKREGVADKPEDFAIPAVMVGAGSLLVDLSANGAGPLTGLLLDDADIIVTADLEALTPRRPTFWRFIERQPTNDNAFDVVTRPDAFLAMWLYLNGTTSSSQDEAQFEETNMVRAQIGGDLVLDGRISIRALAERYNIRLRDAAIRRSVTVPTIVPILLPGRATKSTKAHSGLASARIESNATWGTGNTAGATLRLVTEEILSAAPGSKSESDFMRALGADGAYQFRVDTTSKKRIANPVVAARLPAKIRRVAGGAFSSTNARSLLRGRYGR